MVFPKHGNAPLQINPGQHRVFLMHLPVMILTISRGGKARPTDVSCHILSHMPDNLCECCCKSTPPLVHC